MIADRRYFATDPVSLAIKLIGAVLLRRLEDGTRLAGRIVETEAYCGPEDKAAHSVGWRRTPRTEPMFGPPGTSYVFLTYGMHHCFNIVCGEVEEPVAVLIRALEPTEGLNRIRRAREPTPNGQPRKKPLAERELCSGPARLCQALAIDRTFNNRDLTSGAEIWIEPAAAPTPADELVRTKRVGVEYAAEWADRPLRWYLGSSAHVSVR